MKIIDILNKKANGTLEDGFKFIHRNYIYIYNKKDDNIENNYNKGLLGDAYKVEKILNDEVKVLEENKEIEELNYYTVISAVEGKFEENVDKELQKIINKINELVRAVNKLIKESEGK